MATKAQKMIQAARARKPSLPKVARPVPEKTPQPEPETLPALSEVMDRQELGGEQPAPFSMAAESQFDGAHAADDPDFSSASTAGGEGVQAEAGGGVRLLTKDEFFAAFKLLHSVPNAVAIPPFPLDALPIRETEMDAARQASDTVHDIASETPWLRWLIEPSSLWVQRALVIGAYAVPKAAAVMAEMRAKAARPVNDAPRYGDPQQPVPEQPADASAMFGGGV